MHNKKPAQGIGAASNDATPKRIADVNRVKYRNVIQALGEKIWRERYEKYPEQRGFTVIHIGPPVHALSTQAVQHGGTHNERA